MKEIADNMLPKFLSKEDITFNPEVYKRMLDEISLSSTGRNPKEWACLLEGRLENVNGKWRLVIFNYIVLPAWNIASRQNLIQVNIDDILQIMKKKKDIVGFLHSHCGNNLLPSAADWTTFSYIEGMKPDETKKMVYIIMDPKGNPAIYDFDICNLYRSSFLDLFRMERENAKKRTPRGPADRPDPGQGGE